MTDRANGPTERLEADGRAVSKESDFLLTDLANGAVDEIAATVIRRELKLEPNNQRRN